MIYEFICFYVKIVTSVISCHVNINNLEEMVDNLSNFKMQNI